MCEECGPPTVEDDAWFQHHVVSKGYPKVKRDRVMEGQTSFADVVASRLEPQVVVLSTGFTQEDYIGRTGHYHPLPEGAIRVVTCWCGKVHVPGEGLGRADGSQESDA